MKKIKSSAAAGLRTHEGGKLISGGSENGATFLIEVSDNMATSLKNDKPLLTAMFERENKREKILEAKLREIKLKVKTAQMVHDDNDETRLAKANASNGMNFEIFGIEFSSSFPLIHTAACLQAEQEYFKGVEKEKSKMFPKLYKRKKKQKEDGVDGEEELSESDGSLVSE